MVDLNVVELGGDGHELVPVGRGSSDGVDVIETLDHLAGLLDEQVGLEEGDFVLLDGVDHVDGREVVDKFVSHGAELGDLLGDEIFVSLVLEGEERELGLGGKLLVAGGHGVIGAGIVRA